MVALIPSISYIEILRTSDCPNPTRIYMGRTETIDALAIKDMKNAALWDAQNSGTYIGVRITFINDGNGAFRKRVEKVGYLKEEGELRGIFYKENPSPCFVSRDLVRFIEEDLSEQTTQNRAEG